jgi:C-methyltransferase
VPESRISMTREEARSRRTVLELIATNRITQAIYVAAELGIADLLKDGPCSAEEIAKVTGTSEDGVYRLLRALASLGLFATLPERRFEPTPTGQSLRSDVPGSLRAWARFNGHEITWRPWGELLYSVKTGKSAFGQVFGTTVFEYAAKHPDAGVVFNDAMTALSTVDSAAVAEAYDYSGIETLVDVGGGHGFLLTALLRANTSLRGILYDLPHVVEGAADRFPREGLGDRCAVVGGDFFEANPGRR